MRSRRLVRGTADPDVTGPYQIHDGYIHAYALGGGGVQELETAGFQLVEITDKLLLFPEKEDAKLGTSFRDQ